jgi:hypothetical protein
MKVEGTFFAKLPSVNGEKLNVDIKWDLFEEAFAVAPPKKAEESAAAKGPAKPVIQTFLDPKTAQNLNIWFSRYVVSSFPSLPPFPPARPPLPSPPSLPPFGLPKP